MSQIKELLDYQIYPALYQRIESALPEFRFKRIEKGYQSTTDLKIDGSTGQKGKVYIYDNNISHLKDYTRDHISIWDYIQKRDNLTNFGVLKRLCELSGVLLPETNDNDLEAINKSNRLSHIWEDANKFFVDCLDTTDAQEYRDYLKDRGLENIPEFGFIPSQEDLFEHLKALEHKEEDYKSIELIQSIGNTHKLTLPWRDPLGRVKGIAVRNINYTDGDKFPKYLYSTKLDKSVLFNLKAVKGDKDLIIVEGLIDCLAASRELDNVVALGGASLNKEQIETAIKYGAKKITLCLDNDKAGKEGTLKAIDVIRKAGLPCYVASLSEGIKDPDEYICKNGIDSFKELISNSERYYAYLLDEIIVPYLGKDNLTDKETDKIINDTWDLFLDIKDSLDKQLFYATIERFTNNSVTREGYKAKAEELQKERNRLIQETNLKKLLSDTKELIDKGKLTQAQDLFLERNKEIKIQMAEDLIFKPKFYDFIEDISNSSTPLNTGIKSLDANIKIPLGAITLVAGRPAHGKTTFMFNLMLSMSKEYPDKRFYFFTLEEEYKNIMVKILNRLIEYPVKGGKSIPLTDPKNPGLITNEQIIRAYLKDHREDVDLIEAGKKKLKELIDSEKIVIMDKPNNVEELSLVINHLHKKENIGAVFIDYIQRLKIKQKNQDRRVEINNISDYILNNIAKETGLAVILGAQLNRDTKGGSPKLENLKESGNLEEDANLVLSVYQEAMETDKEEKKGQVVDLEIKVLKNRDGEPNKPIPLGFDRWCRKINDE